MHPEIRAHVVGSVLLAFGAIEMQTVIYDRNSTLDSLAVACHDTPYGAAHIIGIDTESHSRSG